MVKKVLKKLAYALLSIAVFIGYSTRGGGVCCELAVVAVSNEILSKLILKAPLLMDWLQHKTFEAATLPNPPSIGPSFSL